ncbi:Phyllocladan-16-alpha-ol synthase [Gigaspora margarita]|uniref:Phyllocladan-16-alpha-ol synthase n=1 Tax=Gigaspora margarita TaxID=4874 RepID=A0A8H4EJ65_GIGMA|nr:Phyllocladan-16-alpha-ol synthase [Gigaspora margarita]
MDPISKIIKYADELLSECGDEICPEFFKNPLEPARHSIDTTNDSDWIGYGDISMSPYDTAWVAMIPDKIYKESKSFKDFKLAFPQCFIWFFDNQDANGSWAGNGAGSIAPGLAGLLALGLFQSRSGEYFETKLNDLGITIERFTTIFEKARNFLQNTLNEWNIDDLDMTSFELTIPYHLSALAQLEKPVVFNFPESQRLLQENRRKLGLIPLDTILSQQYTTITHSIEAFCEKINLSRIQNNAFQAINGSYGSSPAATASVLMHASKWDDKAFEFLKKTISHFPSYVKSHGLVPTLSDIGIFETIWVMHSIGDLCLKIRANKNFNDKSINNLFTKNLAFIEYLSELNKIQGGTLRWTSWDNRMPADVDDSVVSNWLIKQFDPVSTIDLDINIKTFYNGKYFKSFPIERTFSVSCNVNAVNLLILEYQHAKSKRKKITKVSAEKNGVTKVMLEEIIPTVIKFIIFQRKENGIWLDKWNKSPAYTTFKANDLLLSLQAYRKLRVKSGFDTNEALRDYCRKTVDWALNTQHKDGSWGEPSSTGPGNLEETSYVIRLLRTAAKNWRDDKAIQMALHNGKKYLIKNLDESMTDKGYFHTKQPFLWINKQLYTAPRIIKSSILTSLWED